MDKYNIIGDEKRLQEFIDWLPKLEKDEAYYFFLQARKKYSNSLSNDIMLKRFVCTKKEDVINSIAKLEVEYGLYEDNNNVIPNDALALYVLINPRDLRKASYILISELAKSLRNENNLINPKSKLMTQIHLSKSKTRYICFDVDRDIEEDLHKLWAIIDIKSTKIVQTRGGFHVLVNPEKNGKNNHWYREVIKILNPDQTGDIATPVIGCNQGGYCPRFLE